MTILLILGVDKAEGLLLSSNGRTCAFLLLLLGGNSLVWTRYYSEASDFRWRILEAVAVFHAVPLMALLKKDSSPQSWAETVALSSEEEDHLIKIKE